MIKITRINLIKSIPLLFIPLMILSIFSQTAEESFIRNQIYIQFTRGVEFDNQGKLEAESTLQQIFLDNPIVDIQPVFPPASPDRRLPGMERTYRIKLTRSSDVEETIRRLNLNAEVAFAEPVPLRKMFEISNDPLWNSQYHLALMELDSARDIHKGNRGVSIAIIDGGVNYLHEDLYQDIWVNVAEDVDGDGFLSPADNDSIDADNNGFLDDVIGWDFVHLPGLGFTGEDDSLADNDPMDFGGHGTHCAGDAAAVTDNRTGIASVGGNSSIMCLRAGMTATNGFGYIYYSVEGIYYAANNGARVISMSYGGSSPSSAEQLAIDYAYNLGVISVAAAGNDNHNTPQYPANYNHVLAVAATDQQDYKAAFSNFGSWIDVCAPGVDILSTVVSGNYGNMGGTSMSTPIVAGLAGLAYAMFPEYPADSIINRIKHNCDNIDAINPSYAGQLGSGRVNAYKTLDRVLRILSYQIEDSLFGNNNARLDYGETIDFKITLKNTWQTASGVRVALSCQNPLISVMDSTALLGSIPLGGTASNNASPFIFSVGNDTSISSVVLRITVTADGNYQYQKEITLPIGQRDILIINDDETTGSSKIGYYTQALDSLQKSYDIWTVQQQGTPGTNESIYPVIIWYTGQAEQNVLTADEQQFLEFYLNSGGRLFLTGQNIGYDLVEQQNGLSFFENYLHAQYIRNSSSDFALDGLPSHPIGAGETFIILGSGGANNQNSPDVISALAAAQPAILYNLSNQTEQAAITFAGSYRLVYFAFGWEGINDNGPAKRKNVMIRVVDWLTTATSALSEPGDLPVHQFSVYPNYPNPFNPQTVIPFTVTATEWVGIRIYNSLGQLVKNYPAQRYNPGSHQVVWDGNDPQGDGCPSGIYYYQVKIADQQVTSKMILLR